MVTDLVGMETRRDTRGTMAQWEETGAIVSRPTRLRTDRKGPGLVAGEYVGSLEAQPLLAGGLTAGRHAGIERTGRALELQEHAPIREDGPCRQV